VSRNPAFRWPVAERQIRRQISVADSEDSAKKKKARSEVPSFQYYLFKPPAGGNIYDTPSSKQPRIYSHLSLKITSKNC
jgi:hypothetical protein